MKTLFTLSGDFISSRFDQTQEVLVTTEKNGSLAEEPKTIILDKTSAEDLCNFIIMEEVSCLICGGIEEKHYKYLQWKKITVIDSIIGPYQQALELHLQKQLNSGTILKGAREGEDHHD